MTWLFRYGDTFGNVSLEDFQPGEYVPPPVATKPVLLEENEIVFEAFLELMGGRTGSRISIRDIDTYADIFGLTDKETFTRLLIVAQDELLLAREELKERQSRRAKQHGSRD